MIDEIKRLNFLSQWFPDKLNEELAKLQKDDPELCAMTTRVLRHYQTYNKLALYTPYGLPETLEIPNWSKKPWQLDFHNSGKDHRERILVSANGVGKSISGAYETAIHATGRYPDWWEGKRFQKPPKIWVGSITNEIQKDYIQALLIGPNLGDGLGQGFIPKECLPNKVPIRQCGVAGVADSIRVRHVRGEAIIQYKTYEQGWRKWQASAPDIIWMDEEPDENVSDQKDVFTEAQTRLVRTSGILYVTYTPLLGMTALTDHFLDPQSDQIIAITSTWDDAPHLKKEDKDHLIATYPEHQLEARTKGVPMMGEGRVFTTSEEDIKTNFWSRYPVVPSYFGRIKGIDFGIDHPAAVIDLAWDRDQDVIYVIRARKKKGMQPEDHAALIDEVDAWVPVAWPHDGTNREKGNGLRLKDNYVRHGTKMLSQSARYKTEIGGAQKVEPIIQTIQEMFRTGQLKVDEGCSEFFDEYRNYHRKNGRLTKTRDDILKALFYAVMMRRYCATSHRNIQQEVLAPMMVM